MKIRLHEVELFSKDTKASQRFANIVEVQEFTDETPGFLKVPFQ